MTANVYIVMFASFFASIGDTVFLVGVPLYLFQSFHQSLLASTIVSFLITITVLFASKWIIKINEGNPLSLTAKGELTMGLIELSLLIIFKTIDSSPWVIIAGIIPLALTYNTYAASKFFRIQEYVFPKNILLLTTIQSAILRIGMLVGVGLAGVILTDFGLTGILVFDLSSFITAGVVYLWLSRQKENKTLVNVDKNQTTQKDTLNFTLTTKEIYLCLALVFVGLLFLSWEQAASIATSVTVTGIDIKLTSILRALAGGVGVLLATIIIHIKPNWMFSSWKLGIFAVTFVVMFLGWSGSFGKICGTLLLFCFGAFVATIQTPVQKAIYNAASSLMLYKKHLAAQQMVLRSVLTLSLPLIAFSADKWSCITFDALQISLSLIVLVGMGGGFLLRRLFV
ncbi:MAG: hypothetical protein HY072_07580 [Deltaproteobacteria bacterium]|nr:hypothetical protein [Deltaproteobacteria bacterium]